MNPIPTDTNKELMNPRFKIIAGYPGNNREVGSISIEVATAEYFRKYTANFRELQWWEHREESEMPKYVKDSNNRELVYEPEYYGDDNEFFGIAGDKEDYQYLTMCHIPATNEEYFEYCKNKTL